jgi:hypothetical protein
MLPHDYNSSYSGGRGRSITNSISVLAKIAVTSSLKSKKQIQKCWSIAQVVACLLNMMRPCFNPQYYKERERERDRRKRKTDRQSQCKVYSRRVETWNKFVPRKQTLLWIIAPYSLFISSWIHFNLWRGKKILHCNCSPICPEMAEEMMTDRGPKL